MSRIAFIALVSTIAAASPAGELISVAAESEGMSTERLTRLSRVVERGRAAEIFPGAITVVARNGSIVHQTVAGQRAGAIVERLSGQFFDRSLADHLFEPLDMRDTGFVVRQGDRARLMPLHVLSPGGADTLDYDSDSARHHGTTHRELAP